MKTIHLCAAVTVVAILGLNSLGFAGPLGDSALSGGLSGGLGGGINRGGLGGNFSGMATGASSLDTFAARQGARNEAQKGHDVAQSTKHQGVGAAQGTAGGAKSAAQGTPTAAGSVDASHGQSGPTSVGSSLTASGS